VTLKIRRIKSEEVEEYLATLRLVFAGPIPSPEELELLKLSLELDRTLAAFDGRRIVGTADAISFRITVPGAQLPMAGITRVSVLPTHRRRGLLRALMRELTDAAHDRGEPLAGLYASEAPIYGRFGYGIATHHVTVEVTSHAGFRSDLQIAGRLNLVSRERAIEAFSSVWRKVQPGQPGMLDGPLGGWASRLADLPASREGASAHYRVLYEKDGVPAGFALYLLVRERLNGHYEIELELLDLIAATPDSYASLWRFVLDIDLVSRISAPMRPLLEPLTFLLADTRAARKRFPDSVHEGLWLRLVDVAAALAGRRYGSAGTVVIQVSDEFCVWNRGRFRLDGSPEVSKCTRTNSPADIAIDAADLASAYLGGTRFDNLKLAGKVVELNVGGIALADAMFSGWPAPWCPHVF
jgi:predicted acetyltransferase